jgi:hypothetical protein
VGVVSGYRVAETCVCGATFEVSGPYLDRSNDAVKEWRADHRHEQPTRIPGVDFPPIPQGSQAIVEKAEQFDHDRRPPLGFAGGVS